MPTIQGSFKKKLAGNYNKKSIYFTHVDTIQIQPWEFISPVTTAMEVFQI